MFNPSALLKREREIVEETRRLISRGIYPYGDKASDIQVLFIREYINKHEKNEKNKIRDRKPRAA